MADKGSWSEFQERGAEWFFGACYYFYKIFGWWIPRVLMYPVVTFFYLTAVKRHRFSKEYFERLASVLEQEGRSEEINDWGRTYRHYLEFGRSLFDRVSLWFGEEERYGIEFPNRDLMLDYLEREQGAMLLSAHVGQFDVMRYFALGEGVVVNILAYWNNTRMVNRMMERADSTSQVNIIQVDPEKPEQVLELKDRVQQGELVAILGDRIRRGANQRSRQVPFLGEGAPFPTGPYIIAHLLNCPMLFMYCIRDRGTTYRIHLEKFSDRVQLPRADRDEELDRYLRRYAGKLEEACKKYPYQWYNFYDFWSQEDE